MKNINEYRRLNSVRRRLLHKYVYRIALEGEDHLNECQPRDAVANFRILKRSVSHATSSIAAADGTILSDITLKLNRWKEHFDTMLNRPPTTGSAHITMVAANATEDTSIRTDSPDLQVITKATSRLKYGKALGVCNIPPEVVKSVGAPMAEGLRHLFDHVWTSEDMPEDWNKGIILPLQGKESTIECGNYRGITLLSVPGKVFAHVLLNRIKPLLLSKRRQKQSSFTPGRWTVERILALNILAQTRMEFHKSLFAAYVDLKAAFDSVDRQIL